MHWLLRLHAQALHACAPIVGTVMRCTASRADQTCGEAPREASLPGMVLLQTFRPREWPVADNR